MLAQRRFPEQRNLPEKFRKAFSACGTDFFFRPPPPGSPAAVRRSGALRGGFAGSGEVGRFHSLPPSKSSGLRAPAPGGFMTRAVGVGPGIQNVSKVPLPQAAGMPLARSRENPGLADSSIHPDEECRKAVVSSRLDCGAGGGGLVFDAVDRDRGHEARGAPSDRKSNSRFQVQPEGRTRAVGARIAPMVEPLPVPPRVPGVAEAANLPGLAVALPVRHRPVPSRSAPGSAHRAVPTMMDRPRFRFANLP
jgi:hypothetical protein